MWQHNAKLCCKGIK